MQFDSLCEQYREKLATARTVAKQAVSHEMVQVEGKTKKYHNNLKPYLDRIAKAVDSIDFRPLYKKQPRNLMTKLKISFISHQLLRLTFGILATINH